MNTTTITIKGLGTLLSCIKGIGPWEPQANQACGSSWPKRIHSYCIRHLGECSQVRPCQWPIDRSDQRYNSHSESSYSNWPFESSAGDNYRSTCIACCLICLVRCLLRRLERLFSGQWITHIRYALDFTFVPNVAYTAWESRSRDSNPIVGAWKH